MTTHTDEKPVDVENPVVIESSSGEGSGDTGPAGVNGDNKPEAPQSLRELLQEQLDAEELDLMERLASLENRKLTNNINVDICELVQEALENGNLVIPENSDTIELALVINPETQMVSMATNIKVPSVRVVATGNGEKRRSWFTGFFKGGKWIDAKMKTDVTNDLEACEKILGFNISKDGKGNSTSTKPGKTGLLKAQKVGYRIANNQDDKIEEVTF